MLRRAIVLLTLLLLPGVFPADVQIYKNEGCGHCVMYLDELMGMLERNGYDDVLIKDYMSDDQARKEVVAIQERFSVPLSMQGHLLVLVDDKYLFEGHVPTDLIEGYLKDPKGSLVVTQDSMDKAASYQMLMDGKAHTCSIDTPIAQCAQSQGGSSGSDLAAALPFALLAVAGGFVIYTLRGN